LVLEIPGCGKPPAVPVLAQPEYIAGNHTSFGAYRPATYFRRLMLPESGSERTFFDVAAIFFGISRVMDRMEPPPSFTLIGRNNRAQLMISECNLHEC
jgi:hypothetical protein